MYTGGVLDRVLQKDCRLYLTLDFETQILCVHTRAPVSFQDIEHVELLPMPPCSKVFAMDTAFTDSRKESSFTAGASRRRSLSWSGPRALVGGLSAKALPSFQRAPHGFTLKCRGQKKLCLRCSSAEESQCWAEALQSAIKQAQTRPDMTHKTLLSRSRNSWPHAPTEKAGMMDLAGGETKPNPLDAFPRS
jgi:hypothetical protein